MNASQKNILQQRKAFRPVFSNIVRRLIYTYTIIKKSRMKNTSKGIRP